MRRVRNRLLCTAHVLQLFRRWYPTARNLLVSDDATMRGQESYSRNRAQAVRRTKGSARRIQKMELASSAR